MTATKGPFPAIERVEIDPIAIAARTREWDFTVLASELLREVASYVCVAACTMGSKPVWDCDEAGYRRIASPCGRWAFYGSIHLPQRPSRADRSIAIPINQINRSMPPSPGSTPRPASPPLDSIYIRTSQCGLHRRHRVWIAPDGHGRNLQALRPWISRD
jgi:hypothetical protein